MADRLLARSRPEIACAPRFGCTLRVERDLAVGKVRLIGSDADFQAMFGVAPPAPRSQSEHSGVAYAWLAPGEWLLTGSEAAVAEALDRATGDLVFAVDISAGRTSFLLGGPQGRLALASASPLDTSERSFPVGSVARTLFGQTGAFVARLDDDAAGPLFRIIVDQTMAAHAARMLAEPKVPRSFPWS